MATAEQLDVLRDPQDYAKRAFKSKRALRLLAELNERGWLEYDPFTAKAELTDAGRTVLAESPE